MHYFIILLGYPVILFIWLEGDPDTYASLSSDDFSHMLLFSAYFQLVLCFSFGKLFVCLPDWHSIYASINIAENVSKQYNTMLLGAGYQLPAIGMESDSPFNNVTPFHSGFSSSQTNYYKRKFPELLGLATSRWSALHSSFITSTINCLHSVYRYHFMVWCYL